VIHIGNTWFIGRKLNNNIYSRQGSLLLPKNSILNDHHLSLLHRHGIELWSEDTKLVTELIMEKSISEVQMIYENIHNNKEKLSNRQIQNLILPKIQKLSVNTKLSSMVIELRKKDNYTFRHSIGVAVLSYLLGKWLGLKNEELQDLAVAGVLHDLGKVKIPDEILNKPGRLTNNEYAEIKLHAKYGYEMVQHVPGITEQQALVAIQHHEREDGSGYPYGISGSEITSFSKIVAVTDVFHTMISERVYKKPVPLYQVFLEIYQYSFGKFDPKVVHCFISNVMSRLIGDSVRLTDGRVATIIMLHPDDLINPLVEVQGEYCDLRKSDKNIADFIIPHLLCQG